MGDRPAKTVTELLSFLFPLSSPISGQDTTALFSVMTQVYLPAWPNVALSISPDWDPKAFVIMSLIARPIVAFALCPGPKALIPPLIMARHPQCLPLYRED